MKFLTLLITLVLAHAAFALDLTVGRTLYRDCTDLRIEGDMLHFKHAEGIVRVNRNDLSPDLQAEFFPKPMDILGLADVTPDDDGHPKIAAGGAEEREAAASGLQGQGDAVDDAMKQLVDGLASDRRERDRIETARAETEAVHQIGKMVAASNRENLARQVRSNWSLVFLAMFFLGTVVAGLVVGLIRRGLKRCSVSPSPLDVRPDSRQQP